MIWYVTALVAPATLSTLRLNQQLISNIYLAYYSFMLISIASSA